MSVEGLHASFEKIDNIVRAMILKGSTDTELQNTIRRGWSEQFHSSLSASALRGLIHHYRSVYGVRKTRKRGQVGGMAPLDYTTGPGSASMIYGRFPVEMGASPQAVRALDQFYESPVSRSCDTTGGAPAQTGGGPRQTGGGFFDSLFMPTAPQSIPVNASQTVLSAIQGAPVFNPSSNPVASSVTILPNTPTPFDATSLADLSNMTTIYQGY
jgi:hypothetical protein